MRSRATETKRRTTWQARTEIKCAKCGGPKFVLPRLVGVRKYCSKECQYAAMAERSGPETANFKGDAAGWFAMHLRARGIKKIEGSCERCPSPCEVIHHKDENPWNNDIDNLERLCRPCHTSHHTKLLWERGRMSNRARA